MKKLFTLFAVAVMAFAANAATLTVAEGEATDSHYPFYALYYDTPGTLSQVIYPAEMLTDMVGKQITEIKFYCSGTIYLNGGQLEYSLKVVDQNEFVTSTLVELGEEDVVGHGAPVYEATEFVITLDEPFQYDGGNLLLQIQVTEGGNYQSLYFYGISTGLYGAFYQYQGWSGTWYAYTSAFLPKATFTYQDGTTPPEPPTPTERTGAPTFNGYTTDGIHAYFIEILPTEPSTIYYRIQYNDEAFTGWAEYEDVLSFTEDGHYRVEAYAVAPGKLESYPISYEFYVTPYTGLSE
ncbi:MAG: hypothetical protein IKX18_06240, partial [Muribaculaceae bacterium]|nr:hypothetical protein [Muribaculaceae bacterium]